MVTAVPTIVTFPESKLTLDQKIEKWTWQYCRALEENYRLYSMRHCERNLIENPQSPYYQELVRKTRLGLECMKFRMEFGRKYIKIIQQDFDTFQDRNEYRDGSVHAFVDKNTGEVYKPASWKSPAKIVRYDLRLIKDRANLHNPRFTDWAGGYLYLR